VRTRTFVAIASALLGILGAACGKGSESPRVRLATTTSARDTGLLEWVLPEVERREGVKVSVVAVGTGQALELARRGDADLVIVHDRPREDAFVRDGWGVDRRDLMWNDFVVVGPEADPARIRGTKDAVEALRKIAAAKAPFVSRGDDSGTHGREKSLWAGAGGRPAWDGYAEAGQGQGPTLLIADEKEAYTLTDRATFASMRARMDLHVLVEGDPRLVNPYGAMVTNPERVPGVDAASAKKVLDALTSPAGQARIGAFRIGGEEIFHPGVPPR
jgi:tungstate transport system substrate-binding protein